MRRHSLLLLTTCLSMAINATALEPMPESKATNISSELTETSIVLEQTDCQFSGTFEQSKRLKGFDEGLNSKGVFYHHCQQGVVWSSVEPHNETLVMRRDGHGYMIIDNTITKLKSRQGKFLSNLLNALMSGDQSAIDKQFETSFDDKGLISLKPKKRSLKRAIKEINIQRSADNKMVEIMMLDRNSQLTLIKSEKTSVYNDQKLLKNCQQSTAPDNASTKGKTNHCELLLQIPSKQIKN